MSEKTLSYTTALGSDMRSGPDFSRLDGEAQIRQLHEILVLTGDPHLLRDVFPRVRGLIVQAILRLQISVQDLHIKLQVFEPAAELESDLVRLYHLSGGI